MVRWDEFNKATTWTPGEILDYQTELWLSRKQFEEQLQREARGFEIHHLRMMHQKNIIIERTKNVTSMKI
jgi:hypothetical protein